MSQTPELRELFDIIAIFERQAPLRVLLAEVLPKIAAYLPKPQFIGIYRLIGSNLNIWAAYPSDAPSSQPISLPEALTPTAEHSRWIIPLHSSGQMVGILEVNFNESAPETIPDWVQFFARELSSVMSNFATRELMQQQITALQTINDLATNVNRIQDEQVLFDQTCWALVNALGIDHAALALVDADQLSTTVVSEYPKQGAIGLKLNLDDELQRLVREQAVPVHVAHIENDPRLTPENKQVLKDVGVKSLLIIGLRDMQGTYVGSIGMDLYTHDRQITPEMIDTAQTIITQLVAGMQNSRLLSEAQRRAEQLQYIALFSQSIQATLDEAAIYREALSISSKMLPLDQMNITIYDPVRAQLRVVARYKDGVSSITLDDGIVVQRENTPSGQVWEQRAFLHIADLRQEETLTYPLEPELRSLIIGPIFSKGLMLGMVDAGCFGPNIYTETDIAVFQQMVNQLAVAIENAEAYTQSQQMAKNKALVNEIATQLQQQMDMESILNVMMSEVGKALAAKRGRIRLGTVTNGNE